MIPGNMGHRKWDQEDGGPLLPWGPGCSPGLMGCLGLRAWEVEAFLYSQLGREEAGWESGLILGQLSFPASQSRSQGPAPGPEGQVPEEPGRPW